MTSWSSRPGGSLGMRAYRVLLTLYPPAFRERNGGEMARLFRERAQDARRERGWRNHSAS